MNTTSGSTVIATPSSTTAYTVTGFVANGCSASSSVIVNVQSAATPVITYPGYPNTSALNFCQGDHVLLNAGGPYTVYSWSNGGPPIGTNQTYSATSAGTYKVTVTAANGCTASSSISVTVKASPAIPVISAVGSTTLCDDGSASVILRVTNFTNLDSLTWNNFDATSDTSITVFGNDLTFSFSNPYSFNLMVIDRITLCSSTSNDITVYTDPCGNGIYLNSKILIQGYYTAGGLMKNGGSGYLNVTAVSPDPLDVDTVTLYAMASASPFGEIDHQNGILKTNGDIRVVFGPAVHAGTSYYIKVKHHNSIETWSALPVLFTSPTTYLFITSSSQAFLNNMVVTPDNMGWAIYSGDINQDGATDGNDYLLLDPSIQNGDGGYNNNDLNGDGAVDGRDFLVLDPNIQAGVGVFTPP